MKITIHGCGYVGLVTGACLSDVGNEVLCVDVDEGRLEALNRGEVPIHEPGLAAIIKRNMEAGRLRFTIDPIKAVGHQQQGLPQRLALPRTQHDRAGHGLSGSAGSPRGTRTAGALVAGGSRVSSSRMASSGGLVTWANSCLK